MEFWGIEVKSGEKVKVEPGVDKYLHLSQACIGESKKAAGTANVPVYLNFEGKKLVIGQLSADKSPQISYDLVFEKEFELSHSWKDGSVFFTGYKTIVSDEPEDFGDESSDEEEEELNVEPAAKVENGKPAKKENATAKPSDAASKAKVKPEETAKPPVNEDEDDSDDDEDDDEDDDSVGDSEDESDEENADGDDSDEDDDEDDSSDEEEEKVTPKKEKKRPAPEAKTPVTDNKKAKVVTPAGRPGGADGKKVPHAATPYPKQAGKTPASGDKSKQQTPKSGGSFTCKPCNRSFNSDGALQSHTKAKHSS